MGKRIKGNSLGYHIASLILCCAMTLVGKAQQDDKAILLIHGLAGASSTWTELTKALPAEKYTYRGNYKMTSSTSFFFQNRAFSTRSGSSPVYTLDFSDNQNLSFEAQGDEIARIIQDLSLRHGIKKVVLMGHSMGGLAARAYLQKYGENKIAGYVSVTSPHLGSYAGEILFSEAKARDQDFLTRQANRVQRFLASIIAIPLPANLIDERALAADFMEKELGLSIDAQAVQYLHPASAEMKALYQQQFPENLPTVTVVSNWKPQVGQVKLKKSLTGLFEYLLTDDDRSDYYPTRLEAFSDAFNANFNDGVVTLASQTLAYGVANGSNIKTHRLVSNKMHLNTNKDIPVMLNALQLVLRDETPKQVEKSKKRTIPEFGLYHNDVLKKAIIVSSQACRAYYKFPFIYKPFNFDMATAEMSEALVNISLDLSCASMLPALELPVTIGETKPDYTTIDATPDSQEGIVGFKFYEESDKTSLIVFYQNGTSSKFSFISETFRGYITGVDFQADPSFINIKKQGGATISVAIPYQDLRENSEIKTLKKGDYLIVSTAYRAMSYGGSSAIVKVLKDFDLLEAHKNSGPILPYDLPFQITRGKYRETDDLEKRVREEFGSEYRLADWNDLKKYGNHIPKLLQALGGESNLKGGLLLTRNGKHFFGSSSRHFFLALHNHNKPRNFLVHDHLDNYYLSLGSWHGLRMPLLAIRRKPH